MRLPPILLDIAEAFRFLTRAPLPRFAGGPDSLAHSAKFFPLAGLAIGLVSAFLFVWLCSHLPAAAAALIAVLFTVLVTGGLHEDGLADAADAFGGGWQREQILEILKDSRIGSYGAIAVVFSILSRTLLVAALPRTLAAQYIITAHGLSRWTVLPLGYFLPAARKDAGQGARVARRISGGSIWIGAVFAVAAAAYLLRFAAVAPIIATVIITLLTGAYYHRRIGGITGDCFGATIQLTEIGVYLVAVWRP